MYAQNTSHNTYYSVTQSEMVKLCPICESMMNYYEDGVHDTKEYGFCCPKCELGFYVYRKKKLLTNVKLSKIEKMSVQILKS